MSKFRIFRAKSASTASTASTFSRYTSRGSFPQSRGRVEALAFSMVRLFSPLKNAFYSLLSRGCRGSFPNSSQEIDDLREGSDISPSESEWYGFADDDEGASIYLSDEYDYDDLEDWYEDMCNDVGWPDEDYEPTERWNPEGYQEWLDAHTKPASKSWEQRAVDEAIAEEQPGQYPPGQMGDIPF